MNIQWKKVRDKRFVMNTSDQDCTISIKIQTLETQYSLTIKKRSTVQELKEKINEVRINININLNISLIIIHISYSQSL